MKTRDSKGRFIKGVQHNKGRKMSMEARLKMSLSKKGKSPWNKGKNGIYSKETREKMSKWQIGRIGWSKGKKRPEISGENAYQWKGGISKHLNVYSKRYRFLKMNSGGSHTKIQWEELKKQFNYMCLCCKKFEPDIKLTKDHILPISLGGKDDISNIQPLCKRCNSQKYNKHINYL